jgi:hypothetical protein
MKFDIWVFFENLFREASLISMTRMKDTLHDDLCAFIIIFRLILLTMRNISDMNLRETQNKHIRPMSTNFFRKSCRLWGYVEKYGGARQDTNDNIIWRMRFAYWIIKATDTLSEYIILIAFPQQQSLRERASSYVNRVLPVLLCYTFYIEIRRDLAC